MPCQCPTTGEHRVPDFASAIVVPSSPSFATHTSASAAPAQVTGTLSRGGSASGQGSSTAVVAPPSPHAIVAIAIGHTIDTFFALTADGMLAHLATWSCDLFGRVPLGWGQPTAGARRLATPCLVPGHILRSDRENSRFVLVGGGLMHAPVRRVNVYMPLFVLLKGRGGSDGTRLCNALSLEDGMRSSNAIIAAPPGV